jgi:hypothetical protein
MGPSLGMEGHAMTRRASFAIGLLGCLAFSSAGFAAGPFGTIHVGHWQGGAYTNDSTGAFSHCAAGANYVSGLYLSISQNAERSWNIGFADLAWNLPEGQSFPVTLTFDGQSQFQIFGTSTHLKLVTAILPNPALNALRKSRLMVAQSGQLTAQFDLAMVGKAVTVIANCVDESQWHC